MMQIDIVKILMSLLLNYADSVISLKLVDFRVPSHVLQGMRAQLSCRWQLDPNDVLYSVKWYKDGKEFFRHVPRETESKREFPLPGVDVAISDPLGGKLILSSVTVETAGRYRCEVSGEGPLFPTVSEHGDMEVVVLPEEGPMISGLSSSYRQGDRIKASCSSGRSRPAANLTWYINDEPVSPDHLFQPEYYRYKDGLVVTIAKLEISVNEHLFRGSRIKVKCLATLSQFYWNSYEERAVKERDIVEVNDEIKRVAVHKTFQKDEHNSGNKISACFILGLMIVLLAFE